MRVRNNIKVLRSTRGLSQRKLAKAADIDFSELSKMERGLMVPTNDQWLSLSRVLQVPVDDIYPDPELRKALAE